MCAWAARSSGKGQKLNHRGAEFHREILLCAFSVELCAFVVKGFMVRISAITGGVTFAVKVHARARQNAITGAVGDALKVSLTAPPVDGKGNQGCIEFFANILKVPRSSVTIASGQNSRNKVIRVNGISAEDARKLLAV